MDASENLKKAVAEKDLNKIRGALWSCIVVDIYMTGLFKESCEYVLANGISEEDLFEEDDGKPFETEASKDNYCKLSGCLRVNFSKEKLEALRVMGCTLYPPKESQEDPKKNQDSSENCIREAFGGACVGFVGGALAGAKLGAKVGGIIGGGLVGACIGAAIGYMFFRRKQNNAKK